MARWSERTRARQGLLVRLGLFLLVTVTLTLFIAAQIARVGLGGGYGLTATFDDVSGLRAGDQVKIAGAPVGRVDSVTVVDGRARVAFTVDDGVHVPADSEAAIRWRDAMGRRVIYLVPGSSPRRMRPGTHISRTRSVVDAGELLDRLAPLTRSLDPGQVNALLVSLAQAMDGNGDDITRLITNVDTLTSTIAARRQTLSQMLADYATVTRVVARRDKQIGQAIDDLVALGDGFTRNQALVDDALVQLSGMTHTANDVLGRNAGQLSTLVARLSVLTGGVRRNTSTVAQVLANGTPKLQHIFAAVDNGRFADAAVPCAALSGPPCPYQTRLPGSQEGEGPIDSPKALRHLLIGVK
ncbi:MCE family protein [Actinomadura sp. DC4]|uniref:MCE family protein n=1 Tax=Actinomadura sp. DC4 TaxID=3055069 RepID=UPI0025AF1F13|nr:MCE family protein [Actinomadura sp. DC4]MDN3351306.1 MCE family protein [Actinomadura sp. DC4]